MDKLPSDFATLAPFVKEWAIKTEKERFDKRIASEISEIKSFYDAISPHMDKIGEYFSKIDINENLSEEGENLFSLAASYLEVSRCFEAWSAVDVRHDFFDPNKIQFLHDEW